MKPTIFIGSSSEAIPVSRAIQAILSSEADVTLWDQGVFPLSSITIHKLLDASHHHDYAVFILSNDDLALIRGEIHCIPRDNILFELGVFVATIGLERTFLVIPSEIPNFHIASDLIGITTTSFNPQSHNGNLRAALGVACADIIDAINKQHPLSGEWELYIAESINNYPNGTMTFIAAGDKVNARLKLIQDTDGNETQRSFLYEGRYVAGQVVLTFEQGGAQDLIVGTMVLQFKADRSSLVGRSTFWHHDKAKMVNTDFILKKIRNIN